MIRQAEANIARFIQAIGARQNEIFVDTLEARIRIRTLGASEDELQSNLPRFQQDYTQGVEEYLKGKLNIDDLLTRRSNLFDQDEQISRLRFLVGVNVAKLCAVTGRFFELLEQEGTGATTVAE